MSPGKASQDESWSSSARRRMLLNYTESLVTDDYLARLGVILPYLEQWAMVSPWVFQCYLKFDTRFLYLTSLL